MKREGGFDSLRASLITVCVVLSGLVTACTSDGRLRVPTEVEAGRRVFCAMNPGRCPSTPTPRPTVPPCCVAQGGTYSIEVPGPVCRENDRGCWHDPGDDGGCDSCWHFIPLPGATPTPPPVAPTPTPLPGRTCVSAADCWCFNAEGAYQWCPDPPPTATPTRTPVVSATPTPTSAPVVDCMNLIEPPAVAVPIFTPWPCRRGFVPVFAPIWDQASGQRISGEDRGCVRSWACADGDQRYRPERRIQDSLNGGGPNGVHRCFPGEGPGPEFICDAGRPGQEGYGRNIRDDRSIIVPEGVDHDQPWKRATICGPAPCPIEPTPTPVQPTPAPTPGTCDAVEGVNHWMAPGNKAHGYHTEGDLVRAVIDSTIRSDVGICDIDHVEDFKRCGNRTHDADFRKRRFAFNWTFTGIVEDRGPNTDHDDETCSTRDGTFPLGSPECENSRENSAQRVILAAPGTCVTVTVCIPEDARTPDGCRITARGGGCGVRKFRFPEGGDCE